MPIVDADDDVETRQVAPVVDNQTTVIMAVLSLCGRVTGFKLKGQMTPEFSVLAIQPTIVQDAGFVFVRVFTRESGVRVKDTARVGRPLPLLALGAAPLTAVSGQTQSVA